MKDCYAKITLKYGDFAEKIIVFIMKGNLNMKTNKGFSLVELIVVIAIMAIIAAVAIPVYSVYVDKTNKAADEQLVADIEDALTYAMAANEYTLTGGVVIKLSPENGAQVISATNNADDVAFVQSSLEKAYGSEWAVLADQFKLAYGGWEARADASFADVYKETSYSGNEEALFKQVGTLTNMLKGSISANPNLVGGSFSNYFKNDLGLGDSATEQEKANAAVLYAAYGVSDLGDTGKEAVVKAFDDFYLDHQSVITLAEDLDYLLGTFGAMAAIYAHAEAFVQYSGEPELINTLHDTEVDTTSDSNAALMSVASALGTIVGMALDDYQDDALQYIDTEQYKKDVMGYLAALGTINSNADAFTGDLNNAGCYTDGKAENLVQSMVTVGSLGALNAGEVAISVFPNGTVVSDPMAYLN